MIPTNWNEIKHLVQKLNLEFYEATPKFDIKKYRDNTIHIKMIDISIHLNTNR